MSEPIKLNALFESTLPQSMRLKQEIEAAFGLNVAVTAQGDSTQNCNLLYCRVYLENFPIRDYLFVVNVYGEHALMRFSRLEFVGSEKEAKERLIGQVNFAIRKAGLTFVYEDNAAYDLNETEQKITKSLIPDSYRNKIEALGIDWKNAN